jgi:uncharacterized protein (UPF0261 family)
LNDQGSKMASAVYAIATMDTKGEEIAYVAQHLQAAGSTVTTVDVGTQDSPTISPDVTRDQVLSGKKLPRSEDRAECVTAMSDALVEFLVAEHAAGRVAGVIGIGGGGGTALITAAMRALPIGLPKLMVSTMASGDVAPYVDCSDITMVYSVVDVAGINQVSARVLGNAAHAMAGMVAHEVTTSSVAKPTIAMTMFGVTTPCVTAVREKLEAQGYDCLVFHATGSGGRAMEKLVASGLIQGVLDITTTEVADEVVGGILSAGPQRFDAIFDAKIPCVMSVGALDMVNFGGKETVPPKFQGRLLHVHNAQVTLMRTTPDENREFARWIAAKVNTATTPVTILIPEAGVSMLDARDQAFHDPGADEALFQELEEQINQDDLRRIVRFPHHINDAEFVNALVEEFGRLVEQR